MEDNKAIWCNVSVISKRWSIFIIRRLLVQQSIKEKVNMEKNQYLNCLSLGVIDKLRKMSCIKYLL